MTIQKTRTNSRLFAGGAVLLLLACFLLVFASELPSLYKKWLDEEVAYIITPLEREVFLKLATDRERDLFIEAFWRHRDPTPSSSENEFKTEHYRRINYANHFFGREAPKPGWKTDRGRVYIILGEPNDVQTFEGQSQVYPSEVWFYQGKTDVGLPPGFNLVFFRERGIGEFRLYSPVADGPQALLTSYWGDPVDYTAAYKKLLDAAPLLAEVSLSLVPGEEGATYGRPSLSSDLLLQRVETTPQRMVEEKYAQKFLEYKDIVEVEYSANYINSDVLVKVIRDSSGLDFVHFSIEPERLSVNQYEKKYYTTLKMNGNVTTLEGKPVFQFEREISLDFDEEQMAAISRQPLNIHYMFPLIPGSFRVSILVKNEASKEFTSLERAVSIPGDDGTLQMSSLILGYKVKQEEAAQTNLKPFRLGSFQISCQPNQVFLQKDTLSVAFQVRGLQPEQKEKAEVRYAFFRDEQPFRSFSRKMAEYLQLPDLLEEFSLAEFAPAHYTLRVSLLVDGQEASFAKDEFDITHLESVSRPWVSSRILPAASDAIYDYFVGSQLFNTGRLDEAILWLEKAVAKRADSADFAQNLAQAYLLKDEYKKIEKLLLPFLQGEKPARYELYFLIGKAYQKGREFDKAIAVFDRAVSHYGTNIASLNAIADCYFQKGDAKTALAVWEKSLAVDPNQPQVRKIVEALRAKK